MNPLLTLCSKNKGAHSQRKGFSLLELILAMTMLSIILIGSTTLESSAVRLSAVQITEADLQKQLEYTYRMIEKDLGVASLVQIQTLPDPLQSSSPNHRYQWNIRPLGGNPNGSNDISYDIDLTQRLPYIRRTAGGVTQDLVQNGELEIGPLQYPAPPSNRLAVWFTNANKLMTVNLALKRDYPYPQTGTIELPGYGKSFLIRTATVQDCRGGPCV